MKKIVAIILCVLMIAVYIPSTASAASSGEFGTDGDTVKWSVENGVLTISGSGFMKDCIEDGEAPWSGSEFSSVVIEHGVKNIGDYAFCNSKTIKSVTLPDSIISIGVCAFGSCTGLSEIELNYGLQTIEESAFTGCTGLTSVEIPESVNYLYSAFTGCENLSDITLPESVEIITSDCFRHTAFYDDESNWEDGILYHGGYLLTAEDILGVEESLPDVLVIREGTRIIASGALWGRGITTLSIPDSLQWICPQAIRYCHSLKEIKLGKSNVAFALKYGVLFNKDFTRIILYPAAREGAEYTIPEGVISIESGAFTDCFKLRKVNIPDSVTTIGGRAFEASYLAKIELPDSVTDLGESAFAQCSKLRTVTVSAGLKTIKSGAFAYCFSLERVIFRGKPEAINDHAFENDSKISDVYFTGTETEKNKIKIGFYNSYLENANWHFNTDVSAIPELTVNDPTEEDYVYFDMYQESVYEYEYKTTVKYKVSVPEGAKIQWFLNGKPAGTDSTLEVKDATENYNVDVTVTRKDNTQWKLHLEIKIKNGFFDKLFWFFIHLFIPGIFETECRL